MLCAATRAAVTVGGRPGLPPRCGYDHSELRASFPPSPPITAVLLAIPRGGAGKSSDDSSRKRKFRRRRSEIPKSEPISNDTERKGKPTESKASEATTEPVQHDEPTAAASSSASVPPPRQKTESEAPPIVSEILNEADYYKVLGIASRKDAQSNPALIKKAYRRRALLTHPDKTGGDRRAFDKVAKAYEVLSDDTKKQLYDRFGEKGVEQGVTGGGSTFAGFAGAEDLFRSFFGAGSRTSGTSSGNPYFPTSRRNRTVRYQLEVTLEDLYRGMSRTVRINPPDASPFSRSRYQGASAQQAKSVQIDVPRGALDGQSIVLSGEMDFDQDDTPGDLVFLLQQRQHSVFTREGHDLAMMVKISLQESICGMTRTFRHLDGRMVTIQSAQTSSGEHKTPNLIRSGDVQVLRGRGMPKDAQCTSFGDLYVQYEIETPKPRKSQANSLTSEERDELSRLLNKLEGKATSPNKVPNLDDETTSVLESAAAAEFGVASGRPMPSSPPHSHDESVNDDDEGFSRFGPGSRRFYWSSSSTGSNPFFGQQPGGDHDDGNTQCQQM